MSTERSVIPTPVSGSGAWTPVSNQPPGRGLVYWLSGALVIITIIAATITLAAPHLLTGPAAMNGSARGTALVVLGVAVPSLMLSLHSTRGGSLVGTAILMGTLGYLTYNSIMFVFGTPYNRVFLLYVAMLSLSLWSLLVLVWRVVSAIPQAPGTLLAQRPTWLFQSGPCGEGAQNESIETPRNVAKVTQSHGLQPPVTFGGRLIRSAATGPISRWMGTGSLAGDFRDWARIRAWAGERADDLHHATVPGVSPELALPTGRADSPAKDPSTTGHHTDRAKTRSAT